MNNESPEKFVETLKKRGKYDKKPLPSLLKYLKKIKSVHEYEDYIKSNIFIPIIEWCIEVILIRPIILFACFALIAIALKLYFMPIISLYLISIGISILWYITIDFINELKGDKNGKGS